MCQDQEGFIWFATQGAGLCKFDGRNFAYYSQEHGLPHTQIWQMICDRKGRIWVATDGGLAMFNGKNFETFDQDDGLPSEVVWNLFEDSRGTLWIGMADGGVVKYDGNEFLEVRSINELPFDDGNAIFEDSRGNMWIGSFGHGLARFDGVEYHHYTSGDDIIGNYITSMVEVSTDRVWIGTEAGINVYDGKKFSPLDDALIGAESVEDMMVDTEGNVWIATYDNGLFMWNEHETRHFSKANGLPTNYMYSVLEDNVGNIWVGTNGGGVSKFEGEMFTHITSNDGLLSDVVMSILEDSKGNFWFATEEGLTRKDRWGHMSHFTKEDGLASNDLYYVFEDSHGSIWVSTFNGVSRITDGEVTSYGSEDGFTNSTGSTFFEDEFGRLWIGSDEGVHIYFEGEFEHYNPDSLLSVGVARIYQDSKGSLWFCTAEGVVNIQVDKAVSYTTEDGLVSGSVSDVWEDPSGKMWFLTDRGISVLSQGHFYSIGSKNGLASDNLYSMIYDGVDLWVGTEKGIDRIYLDENFELDSVEHYGRSEGFRGVECNGWAAYMDSKGFLWFGTIKGATRYNARHDNPNIIPPLVKLTNLRLFYEDVDWVEKCVNEIEAYRDVPIDPCLDYRDNHLTIDFIGLDFTTPEDVRYRFKLVGFDTEWQPETDQNSVTYSNLPPGEFVFNVIARNGDGVWSEPVTYSFVIEAPFWLKTWFYVISIPLGLGIIYVLVLLRTRRIARSKRQLEELIRLRTRDLRKQKKEVEKLSVVASQTEDGIIIADASGEITWMNQSLRRMTGLSLEKFKERFGPTVSDLSDHEDIEGFLKRIKTRKETLHYDVQATPRPGEESRMWLSASITPAYDADEKLSNIVVVYTDITDRKNAEDQLIRINKDITDSIQYASQIQEAIMPNTEILKANFPESFVFFRPRDIVSGDFYWFTRIGEVFVWCAVDCTGHGVPGAFMSMIGNEFLHQIVNNGSITGPEQALEQMDAMIKRALHKTGEDKDSKDGMDLAMVAIHMESMMGQYSGAFNPMYLVRDGELQIFEANKVSIGSIPDDFGELQGHEFKVQPGDSIYVFSDGFIDQFGGEHGKKYMRGRFKKFILSIQDHPMDKQLELVNEEFDRWKGERDQLDDVLVIGVKVENMQKDAASTKRRVKE